MCMVDTAGNVSSFKASYAVMFAGLTETAIQNVENSIMFSADFLWLKPPTPLHLSPIIPMPNVIVIILLVKYILILLNTKSFH